MNTFYQMQQLMEAKKMEMEMHVKESSYSYHLINNKEKFSLLGSVKKLFSFRNKIDQNEPCCVAQ